MAEPHLARAVVLNEQASRRRKDYESLIADRNRMLREAYRSGQVSYRDIATALSLSRSAVQKIIEG